MSESNVWKIISFFHKENFVLLITSCVCNLHLSYICVQSRYVCKLHVVLCKFTFSHVCMYVCMYVCKITLQASSWSAMSSSFSRKIQWAVHTFSATAHQLIMSHRWVVDNASTFSYENKIKWQNVIIRERRKNLYVLKPAILYHYFTCFYLFVLKAIAG